MNFLKVHGLPFAGADPILRNRSNLRGGSWEAVVNSTSIASSGQAPTVVSNGSTTPTARTITNTSFLSRQTKVGIVTTASPTTLCELYDAIPTFYLGYPTDGGLKHRFQLAISDAAIALGSRSFVGLMGSGTALTNVEPNTLTNVIGFCQLSTTANWQFIWNGAGTASVLDTGIAVDNTSVMEFGIWSEPGSGIVVLIIYNATLDVMNFVTVTSNLPAVNTLLARKVFRTNGATAAVQGIDLMVQSYDRLY